ncbi:ral guanine nucleotide dissociation stimulator-like isoform X1 [Equus przewalskii]|uniref:Ral guanine nucleotide dissociation stimulator-like isoform X1 n=1 Tax=Equus przewalskii TaxID=9798 RepID=A0ABM4LF58_EQUPR
MEDYVECPAGFPQPCVHPVLPLAQEFKLMEEIELLQEATSLYTLQPVEHFGAWFQAVEPLSEEKRGRPGGAVVKFSRSSSRRPGVRRFESRLWTWHRLASHAVVGVPHIN